MVGNRWLPGGRGSQREPVDRLCPTDVQYTLAWCISRLFSLEYSRSCLRQATIGISCPFDPSWHGLVGPRSMVRKLRQLREAGIADMRQYRGIIENDMIFYVPWVSIPAALQKVVLAFTTLRVFAPLAAQQIRENLGTPSIVCRRVEIHRNAWGAVLNADVVMQGLDGEAAVDAVIKYRRYIVRSARRHARKLNRLAGAAYLPWAFVQVNIYRRDYARVLCGSRLIPCRRRSSIRRRPGVGSTRRVRVARAACGSRTILSNRHAGWRPRGPRPAGGGPDRVGSVERGVVQGTTSTQGSGLGSLVYNPRRSTPTR